MIFLSVTSFTCQHANVKCLNVISYFWSCLIQLTPQQQNVYFIATCCCFIRDFDLKRWMFMALKTFNKEIDRNFLFPNHYYYYCCYPHTLIDNGTLHGKTKREIRRMLVILYLRFWITFRHDILPYLCYFLFLIRSTGRWWNT